MSTVSKREKTLSLQSDQFKEYITLKIHQDGNKYETAKGSILEAELVAYKGVGIVDRDIYLYYFVRNYPFHSQRAQMLDGRTCNHKVVGLNPPS